jgi:hypothetical protein
MKVGDFVTAPKGCNIGGSSFITPGKKYKILETNTRSSFTIQNDIGVRSYCLRKGCAHIAGKDWILGDTIVVCNDGKNIEWKNL